jgi:hypothetical protein
LPQLGTTVAVVTEPFPSRAKTGLIAEQLAD